jgi:hypothetical protein
MMIIDDPDLWQNHILLVACKLNEYEYYERRFGISKARLGGIDGELIRRLPE